MCVCVYVYVCTVCAHLKMHVSHQRDLHAHKKDLRISTRDHGMLQIESLHVLQCVLQYVLQCVLQCVLRINTRDHGMLQIESLHVLQSVAVCVAVCVAV